MKLGITQLLPRTLAEIDDAVIRRVRELGFTGTALSISDDPATITTEHARELGRRFAAEGVDLVEYGHYQTTFVDRDPSLRAASLTTVREAARVAAAVGCPAIVVGIGSLNPAGQWFPHPDNFTAASRERLIASLTEAAAIAEAAGVTLALECHVATTLRDAGTARAVLEAVGSPVLKVHLDVVNWMSSLDDVYDSGQAIAAMFDALGPQNISGAHSKGVMVQNQLIVHLDETYTGSDTDLLDHAALLRKLATMPDETYLVIEHLSVEEMPRARARLLAVAKEIGVSFVGQETGGNR